MWIETNTRDTVQVCAQCVDEKLHSLQNDTSTLQWEEEPRHYWSPPRTYADELSRNELESTAMLSHDFQVVFGFYCFL